MTDLATFQDTTTPTLHFERTLAHPVDAVWRAISEFDQLAHWYPCLVSGEMRQGGRLSFDFVTHEIPQMSGEVTEYDPPRRLSFRWADDHLHFTLEPAGEGTRLRLSVELDTADKAARDGAGWTVCLARLERQLAGGDGVAPTSELTPEWRELYDEYQRRGFPADAPLPE